MSAFAKNTVAILALAILTACGGVVHGNAPEVAARAHYVHNGPPEIALITIIHKPTDFMWHSALLINADERVLFESGGFWNDPDDHRLNDIVFNMTDERLAKYADHRGNLAVWDIVMHRVPVSAQVAMAAKQRAMGHESVVAGFCAQGVASVLQVVPGLEGLGNVILPHDLVPLMEKMPGVRIERLLPSPKT